MEENIMTTENTETTATADKKFCTSCGAELNVQAVMCPTCGAMQESKDDESQAAKKGKKLNKKLLIIGGAVAAVIIAIAVILLIPTEFERVKDECVSIAGIVSSTNDNNFIIDTKPYPKDYLNTLELQEKALEAIKYANKEFGFDDSVYTDMLYTSASMGTQFAKNDKYMVSWTYHPDEGLEVKYIKI